MLLAEPMPTIALEDAITMARTHLEKEKINLQGRQLLRAEWIELEGAWCWYLQWLTKSQFEFVRQPGARGGGGLAVYVSGRDKVDYHYER